LPWCGGLLPDPLAGFSEEGKRGKGKGGRGEEGKEGKAPNILAEFSANVGLTGKIHL